MGDHHPFLLPISTMVLTGKTIFGGPPTLFVTSYIFISLCQSSCIFQWPGWGSQPKRNYSQTIINTGICCHNLGSGGRNISFLPIYRNNEWALQGKTSIDYSFPKIVTSRPAHNVQKYGLKIQVFFLKFWDYISKEEPIHCTSTQSAVVPFTNNNKS